MMDNELNVSSWLLPFLHVGSYQTFVLYYAEESSFNICFLVHVTKICEIPLNSVCPQDGVVPATLSKEDLL